MAELTTSKTSAKKRGNSKTPSKREYIARNSRAMKKSVELYKTIRKKMRITQEERNCLAYFLNPM